MIGASKNRGVLQTFPSGVFTCAILVAIWAISRFKIVMVIQDFMLIPLRVTVELCLAFLMVALSAWGC